jgi:PAS domain S-box-containing protein
MKSVTNATTRRGERALQLIAARQGTKAALPKEYQTLFTNNGKPMVIVEADATISLANAEFERLSGYTKREIEGKKSWTEFVARSDRKRLKEYHLLRESDPMLAPRCFEFQFIDRRGKIKNVVLTLGQVPGTHKSMASLQDITDRRREEATRRVSEERYKTLFENSQDAIYITMSNGEYIDANKAALKLFGYTRSEIRRVKARELYLDPADARRFQQEIEKKGFVQEHAARLRKKDGTAMDCLLTVTAQRADDGCILEYQGIIRDITERKQTAEMLRKKIDTLERRAKEQKKTQVDNKLRQSEERFRRLVETMRVGLSAIDAKRVITYINDQMCQMLGYTMNEMIGRPTTDFQDEESRKRQEEVLAKRRKGLKTPTPYEITWVAKDGHTVDTIVTPTPDFSVDGHYAGSFAIITDITEQKQAERELKRHRENLGALVAERTAELQAANEQLQREVVEHKQATEDLQASEEHFKMLADSAPFGISIMAPDKRFEYFNPKFTEIFGYTREDIRDKDIWLAKAYPDVEYRNKVAALWVRDLAEAAKIGEDNPRVFTVHCKNGADKIVDFRTVYLKDGSQYLTYEDITKRKKMEEELRQSEERFRLLVETMRVGLSAIDGNGLITYANDQMCQMLGYSRDEIIGRPTVDFYDEESRKHQEEIFAKRRKGEVKNPTPYEITWVAKDGHKVNTILTPTPKYDADGHFISSFAIFTDITERKQLEDELKTSRMQLEDAMDMASIVYWERDPKTGQLILNDAFYTLYGTTAEAEGGYTMAPKDYFQRFIHPDDLPLVEKNSVQQKKDLKDLHSTFMSQKEHRVIRRDGEIRHLQVRNRIIKDALGNIIKYSGTNQDITERKEMEEQIRKSEELYRTLIETTKVGVSAINENGVIMYANERFAEIWGYAVNEIMGHRATAFLDEDNLRILQKQLSKRWEGARDPYEIAWKRKDGTNVPTILAPTPIFDEEGRYKGSYGFITDITERKQIEDRLQRYADELERSNEEVKNFAYIVSHDLRVPLVNLKGYSAELGAALEILGANFDAVLSQLPDEKRSEVVMALHEDIPEALEFITNSVSRMDSFINAVLILSRLGRRELKAEPIDMNALVKTIVEGMSHQIQEKGITITVAPLPEVVADRTAMEQIMGNILGNAVKYLDHERPGEIEVTGEANGGETAFRIRDNGRGIAADDMEKVFAPFRRAGKQDTPGEGMGLSYVQTLVRRHNGRIWCESELEKGTTFTFTISNPSEQGSGNA